jgi:hypothetical protein
MSLRDLLIEELKHRGVTVVPEVSFRSVDGRRLVPDLVLHDGAEYVIETNGQLNALLLLMAHLKLLKNEVRLFCMG